jgi:hypothetical protein
MLKTLATAERQRTEDSGQAGTCWGRRCRCGDRRWMVKKNSCTSPTTGPGTFRKWIQDLRSVALVRDPIVILRSYRSANKDNSIPTKLTLTQSSIKASYAPPSAEMMHVLRWGEIQRPTLDLLIDNLLKAALSERRVLLAPILAFIESRTGTTFSSRCRSTPLCGACYETTLANPPRAPPQRLSAHYLSPNTPPLRLAQKLR